MNPLGIFGWFTGASAEAIANWLGGLGGDIASGIEGGFVQTLKDIFGWMIPWFEIGMGIIIAIFVLAVYFHEETIQLGKVAGMAAMA